MEHMCGLSTATFNKSFMKVGSISINKDLYKAAVLYVLPEKLSLSDVKFLLPVQSGRAFIREVMTFLFVFEFKLMQTPDN